MTSTDKARAAFEKEIASMTGSAGATTIVVDRSDLAVPGFGTFEARLGDQRAGGWASAAGVVVLSAYINFRPIAEALGVIRGDGATPAELARRVAWAYGPTWSLIEQRPADLGAAAPSVEPANRIERPDGSVCVGFHLRDRNPADPTIIKFAIDTRDGDDAIASTWQLWPKVDG